MAAAELKRTPLYPCHRESKARMVEFGGWEMPVQYTGVLEEHQAVRQAAGLFDVSHMGEIRLRGPRAFEVVQWLTPNDVKKLKPGRAHYSGLLTEKGTYIDDIVVYRMADDDLLLVVNANNIDKDLDWIRSHAGDDVEVLDESPQTALLALQGPRAEHILGRLTDLPLHRLRYYRFLTGQVGGVAAMVSRTGYTGEDGFEIYVGAPQAPDLWRRLMEVGADQGLRAAGLGARDTLRLEAGMLLYGQDLDTETTPFEAGLDWVVKLHGEDFLGRDALVAQRAQGVESKLVGFELLARGIARHGHGILVNGERRGVVTSGTWSPTLEKSVGLARVPQTLSGPGTALQVEIRAKSVAAVVAELPFYRRSK